MNKALFIDRSGSMISDEMPNVSSPGYNDVFYFDMHEVTSYAADLKAFGGSSCDKIVEFCNANKGKWDEIAIYTDGYILPPPVSFEMKITWLVTGDPEATKYIKSQRPQDNVVYV